MRDRVKQCADCGDDMPFYSRVCPFCHYTEHYSQFDVQSSPYVMMSDLKSLCTEYSQIGPIGGVGKSLFRLFTFCSLDAERERVQEIETTFEVIHEQVLDSFGRHTMVAGSLMIFEDVMRDMHEQRAKDVARMRALCRQIISMFCVVIALASLSLYVTLHLVY